MYDEDLYWPNGFLKSECDSLGNQITVKKKSTEKEPQYAFIEFFNAIMQRISNPKKSITSDGRDYKDYYHLKDSLMNSSVNDDKQINYYQSKLGGYFKNLISTSPYILYLRTDDYFNSYIYLVDDWIEKYGLGRHDVIHIDSVVNNHDHEYPTTIEELQIINDTKDQEESNKKRGRPAGSKNKKCARETFLPEHNIVIDEDGRVNLESFIFAVADLVWRTNNQTDFFYLNQLNMNDKHKRFINYLILTQNKKLVNSYWKINKIGDVIKFVALRKRAGYYFANDKNQYKLFSLTQLAKLFNLPIKTLEYKLKFKSIKQVKEELINKPL